MADTKKVANTIGKAISFLFLAIAVINLAIIVLTSALMPIVMMIICMVCFIVALRRQQYTAKTIALELFTMVILICFIFVTSVIGGGMKWQYPFQCWYIEFMANDDTDGFFPDKLPEDAENFRTEYCPPMMQASGYYYICFNTEDIEQYKAFTENSVFSLTMEEYNNGLSEENDAKFNELAEEGHGLDFYVNIPDCVDESDSDTEIHIINSNFYWNHPHTDIIFINYDEKLVCFYSVG
ncbi:MAG: hypothetical protein IJZ61_06615 [Oscillospiraceae bacterium]|nr:hypothetical protein [Oscillospiraceae bacterium]